jgi:hypothetical protein
LCYHECDRQAKSAVISEVPGLVELSTMMEYTYSVTRVDVVNGTNALGRLDNSGGLDGDAVSESFALAIYDAGYEDIAPDSMSLGRLDDDVVR